MKLNPKSAECPVKQQLIAELQSAHARIVALGEQEMQAIMRGDIAFDSALAQNLKEARHARQSAMQALREHLAEHRCSGSMEPPMVG